MRMALRAAGLENHVMDPATEAALVEFYTEWVSNAVALGCEAAKRRKSGGVLKARDIALHLERSWNLAIPGFAGDVLKPYRRANASELHRQRAAAVRRTAQELDKDAQHHYQQLQQQQQQQPASPQGPPQQAQQQASPQQAPQQLSQGGGAGGGMAGMAPGSAAGNHLMAAAAVALT